MSRIGRVDVSGYEHLAEPELTEEYLKSKESMGDGFRGKVIRQAPVYIRENGVYKKNYRTPLQRLSRKHEIAIHNYCVLNMTGADAYRNAGYNHKDPSTAFSMLMKEKIFKEAVDRKFAELALSREQVESEYSKMVRDGEVKPSEKATFMRDYCKLRGWLKEEVDNESNNKLLGILGKALDMVGDRKPVIADYSVIEEGVIDAESAR